MEDKKEKRIATIVLAVACVLAVGSIFAGIFMRVVPAVKKGKESLETHIKDGIINFGALDADDIKDGFIDDLKDEFISELRDELTDEFTDEPGDDDFSEKGAISGAEQTFADISGLDIEMSIGKVTVVSGSENKVNVTSPGDKLRPTVTLKDGIVHIGQKEAKGIVMPGSIKGIKESIINCNINVEVTVKDPLRDIECDADIGDIKFDGITADKFELEADCGNIEISNCSFGGKCETEVDLGNTKIIKCTFNNLDTKSDIGDITIETVGESGDYTVKAGADLGTVKVFGSDEGKSCNTGSGPRNITAECSMGAILIK